MNTQNSRRAFLRGRFADKTVMRPPGATSEAEFQRLCSGCGDCVSACPEAILVDGGDGTPTVNFANGACTFCNECSQACKTGALDASRSWAWRASASDACLSMNAVQCRACQDHCDMRAIRFRLLPGGRAEPEFDTALCTGCGGCVAPCPVEAIHLSRPKPEPEIRTC